MTRIQIYTVLLTLMVGLPLLGQTGAGSLFYDIGLRIEDSSKTATATALEKAESLILSQEQQDIEEELNRYQQKLAETEIQLRYQTMVIDSLQSEMDQVRAAGETDRALLSTRITSLVDQQENAAKKPVFFPGETQISDSVFAELHTPWRDATVSVQPIYRVQAEPKLTEANERAAYRRGLTKFHQKYYYQAIDEFNTIVHRGTDITLRANAQYWVGRCYFEKGLYDKAISSLEQVQRFEHSDKLDDALVMIGLAFKNKDRLPEAKLAFQELVSRHPGSEYLILAKRFVQE